jgi:hypothetical protein
MNKETHYAISVRKISCINNEKLKIKQCFYTVLPVIIFAILTLNIERNHIGLVNKKNKHIAISSLVNSCVCGMWGAL